MQVREHPYPLPFTTISGVQLYGFRSPDSDYRLRGGPILPLDEVIGLEREPATTETAGERDGLQLDLVTHDAGTFFGMLLRRNGHVLNSAAGRWWCARPRSTRS